MAGRVRVEWDRQGMNALLVSNEMAAMTRAAATAGMVHAKSISPRSTEQHKHYAESFVVRKATFNDARGGTRVGAILANTADHAGAVEWGLKNRRSSNMPDHVLARTVSFIEGGA